MYCHVAAYSTRKKTGITEQGEQWPIYLVSRPSEIRPGFALLDDPLLS